MGVDQLTNQGLANNLVATGCSFNATLVLLRLRVGG